MLTGTGNRAQGILGLGTWGNLGNLGTWATTGLSNALYMCEPVDKASLTESSAWIRISHLLWMKGLREERVLRGKGFSPLFGWHQRQERESEGEIPDPLQSSISFLAKSGAIAWERVDNSRLPAAVRSTPCWIVVVLALLSSSRQGEAGSVIKTEFWGHRKVAGDERGHRNGRERESDFFGSFGCLGEKPLPFLFLFLLVREIPPLLLSPLTSLRSCQCSEM